MHLSDLLCFSAKFRNSVFTVQVPVGVAVEQPGGDYAYGAPASPVRGHAYVPPSHPAAAAGQSPMAMRGNDSLAEV